MKLKQNNTHDSSQQGQVNSLPLSVNLSPGQHLHGFEVKAVTPIDELHAVAIELYHPHSGARLMHFWTEDPRNLFSISPLTPVPDDTGLTHILEHCVTKGSRDYPIKGGVL